VRLRLLALLAAAAALPVAAHAAKPKRTFVVNPPQQFVTALVQIRGAHWSHCAARVGVSVRMPSGKTKTIGRPRLTTAGSFRTSWRPPVGTAGHTLRIRAVEACGRAGTVSASAPLKVLPTP
jgi:hypothetical protein